MSVAPWRCPHASRPGDVRMPRALAMSAYLAPWRCPYTPRMIPEEELLAGGDAHALTQRTRDEAKQAGRARCVRLDSDAWRSPGSVHPRESPPSTLYSEVQARTEEVLLAFEQV
ncbi:hypothetical protein VNO80_15951 [Phaseolus coccineus]|uniref:Uncharacterized protein n=1 Tax=Phaseolus coccineus TaxID=3886 RepID=A0AAN9R2R1_PHACN